MSSARETARKLDELAGTISGTEEHVPPRSFGGRGLLLTCKPCNDIAGHDLDAHARRKENVVDALGGHSTTPRRVRIDIADRLTLNAEYHCQDTERIIRVSGRNNHPEAGGVLRGLMNSRRARHFTLTFIDDRFTDSRSKD